MTVLAVKTSSRAINDGLGLITATHAQISRLKQQIAKERVSFDIEKIGAGSQFVSDQDYEDAGRKILEAGIPEDKINQAMLYIILRLKRSRFVVLVERFVSEPVSNVFKNIELFIGSLKDGDFEAKLKELSGTLLSQMTKNLKEFCQNHLGIIPDREAQGNDGSKTSNFLGQLLGAIEVPIGNTLLICRAIYNHLAKTGEVGYEAFRDFLNSGKALMRDLAFMPAPVSEMLIQEFLSGSEKYQPDLDKFNFGNSTIVIKSEEVDKFIDSIKALEEEGSNERLNDILEICREAPIYGCPAKYAIVKLESNGKVRHANLLDATYMLIVDCFSKLKFGKRVYG